MTHILTEVASRNTTSHPILAIRRNFLSRIGTETGIVFGAEIAAELGAQITSNLRQGVKFVADLDKMWT